MAIHNTNIFMTQPLKTLNSVIKIPIWKITRVSGLGQISLVKAITIMRMESNMLNQNLKKKKINNLCGYTQNSHRLKSEFLKMRFNLIIKEKRSRNLNFSVKRIKLVLRQESHR